MGAVRFTRRAREDLLDLWVYLYPKNPVAADRLYDRVEECCRALRDFPQLGPARPDIAAAARMHVIDRWLVLYRLTDDGVQIVRIVDGMRDLTTLEWSP